MRYAILVRSRWPRSAAGAQSSSADSGQMLLVDAGQSAAASQDVFLWLLAGIATLITPSLFRFVVFGLPSMVDGWYTGQQGLDLHASDRGADLRGVLFDEAGRDSTRGSGGAWQGTFCLSCIHGGTRQAARRFEQAGRKVGRPSRGGRPILFGSPSGTRVRRCNTCRTRSGAASSRTARPLPSSARDRRRSRRR